MKKILALAALLILLPTITSTGAGPRDMPFRAVVTPVGIDPVDSIGHRALTAADSLRALEKLAADISALIKLPEAKTGNVGIEVKSLSTQKTLYSLNPGKPLTPASTTKVVTTFTALCELGSNYMVRTTVASERPPREGVVNGNLYVKGYGDPFFSINEVDQLVDRIVAAGIKHVDGSIIGDGTFFDDKTERTQYSGDDDVVMQLPPIAALTIERSVFTVVISSSRTPGVPCNVQTYPPSSGFHIVNTAVTSAAAAPRKRTKRGKRRSDVLPPAYLENSAIRYGDESPLAYDFITDDNAGDELMGDGIDETINQRKPKKGAAATPKNVKKGATAKKGEAAKKSAKSSSKQTAAKTPSKKNTAKNQKAAATRTRTAPARTVVKKEKEQPAVKGAGPVRVSLTAGENGRQIITVSGSLPPGRTVSYRYQMKNPPMVIAGMIHDRLRSHGITITGQVTSGVTPARTRVIAEVGRPLQEILQIVMKKSNNLLAEYVFKMIGGAAGGQQETAQKTVEKIQQRMSVNSVPFGQCIINDGSGLSRANCLSASALNGILTAAHNDRKVFEPFYQSMSIAGVDGTLRGRMKGTRAEGNVHGKTGTLRNVSALTGYVTTRDGEQICFAMLMNGSNHGAYKSVQDRIAARLASFSYVEALVVQAEAKTEAKAK